MVKVVPSRVALFGHGSGVTALAGGCGWPGAWAHDDDDAAIATTARAAPATARKDPIVTLRGCRITSRSAGS
jgi:hypothetical protein